MGRHRPKFAGPIRVLSWARRHALDAPRDDRIVLLEPGDDSPPDILIVAASRSDFFETTRERMSPALAQRIAEGRCALVFDASAEGVPFDGKQAKLFHRLLRDFEISGARVAYLTQNRDYAAAYAAWGGPDLVRMKVLEYDDFIRRFFQEHDEAGAETFAARRARFEARAATREKRFVCLNFSPRTAKVMLLLKLIQGGEWDQGFISFPGFDASVNTRAVTRRGMIHDLLTLPGFEDMGAELVPLVDALAAKGNVMLGEAKTSTSIPHHYKPLGGDMALEEYDRAWFTVTTETEMTGTRRITEKPFKALANFSPLILLGNAGSLALIRHWDFRTFGELFDESYDAEPDPRRRFEQVYAEIRRVCALPEAKLREAEAAMAETIVFNAERALVHMPRFFREKFEPWLIDQVLQLRPRF